MTKQERFARLVQKVGKSFYMHFISRVRQSVKDGTLKNLSATAGAEWPGDIKTARFRINYMANAVRAGYDSDATIARGSNNKTSATKTRAVTVEKPINYWIEMYWPSLDGRRRYKEYNMWINKRKKATHKNISAGDIVFYYETQWKGKDHSIEGAMRLFAAGVVTNDFNPVDQKYRNVDGKKWNQWRTTKIIAWVPPAKGIPREIFNKDIGKQEDFIMRYAPYKIKTASGAVKILKTLQRLDPHCLRSYSKYIRQFRSKRSSREKGFYEIVEDKAVAKKAQLQFLQTIRKYLPQKARAKVGFHGGSSFQDFQFSSERGVWFAGGKAINESGYSRFWNTFGVGEIKATNPNHIICEINPPAEGIRPSCGGVFLVDENGRLALASRGKIGGGKEGIGKQAFIETYKGKWITVCQGGNKHRLVLLGYVDSKELVENLQGYIELVAKIKGSSSFNKDAERELALAQAAASGNTGTLSPSEREGLRVFRKSWRIERSAKNRRLARIKWGNNCSCVVCRLNFNKKYGQDIARGYIEFHHLRPLSAGAYTPRPEKDLVPVCSNCHSMLHRHRPNPIPILELQKRLG